MPKKDDNVSKYFKSHKNEEYTLENQNIERNHRNLVRKSLNTGNHARKYLSGCISQDGLFESQLLLFLREVKFGKLEIFAGKLVSDIKYHYLGSKIIILFTSLMISWTRHLLIILQSLKLQKPM